MQQFFAFRKVRALFSRSDAEAGTPADDTSLSGPTLLQQEPDLMKEAGRHVRESSGWAAGGHPSD